METIALICSVFAMLFACVALFGAFQVSKKSGDKVGVASTAAFDEALKRLTALETPPPLTWEEVNPYMEKHFYPKKVIHDNFIDRTKFDKLTDDVRTLAAYVDKNNADLRREVEDQLDVVNKGVENFIDAQEVDKKIEAALALVPSGSATPVLPQTERRTVVLEKAVKALVESLQLVGHGLPSKSRKEIEAEIVAIENRGVEGMKTLQQNRSEASKRLNAAELEMKEAERALLPQEPTDEMAEAFVEKTMPTANYKEKGQEFDRYQKEVHPALRREATEKFAACEKKVAGCKEALERARSAQEAFQRDMQRTKDESDRLQALRADLSSLDKLSASVACAERSLRSVPASNAPAPPPRCEAGRLNIPAPPLAVRSERPIGYVPEEEILSVSDSEPPPDSSRFLTRLLEDDQRKTVVRDDEDQRKTLVKDEEDNTPGVKTLARQSREAQQRQVPKTLADTVTDGKKCLVCGLESLPECKFCAGCGELLPRDM